MKRIPLRIFIIVLITGIIGVTGMVVLKYNSDKLSNTYHVIMDEHAANQDYMKSIMTHLYQHKAHVMDHILANSEDMYDKYEQKEVELRNKMIDEFNSDLEQYVKDTTQFQQDISKVLKGLKINE